MEYKLSLEAVAASGISLGHFETLMGAAGILCAGMFWKAIFDAFLN
jgi:hypothetical protein